MMKGTKQDEHTIETMIDRIGLSEVLGMIADICIEKAEHIRVNWQDSLTAKHWDTAGQRVDNTRASVESVLRYRG